MVRSLVLVPWKITDYEPEGHRGLALKPTASVWQSWDLNPSQNLKAIALPIPSLLVLRASGQRRDKTWRGRGRQRTRESEKAWGEWWRGECGSGYVNDRKGHSWARHHSKYQPGYSDSPIMLHILPLSPVSLWHFQSQGREMFSALFSPLSFEAHPVRGIAPLGATPVCQLLKFLKSSQTGMISQRRKLRLALKLRALLEISFPTVEWIEGLST